MSKQRFRKIYIEITNRCNLHCDFCLASHREVQDMDVEQFAYVLQAIRPYTDYIYLHVLGEPLCHPHLDQLLLIARQGGFQVNMTTNGVFLPKQLPHLLNTLRQCNISLHSFPQHSHTDTYLTDCLMAGDRLANQGTYISYRFWNQRSQENDPITITMLKQISEHYDVSLTAGISQKLTHNRFIHFDHPFHWPMLQAPLIAVQGHCYGLRSHCAILVDGTVVPCCLDGEGVCTLGNVFTTPFADIIESSRAKQIVQGFQQGKLSEVLCQHCDYRCRFDKEELC